MGHVLVASRPVRAAWRVVRPRSDESVRWESGDGRWLTVVLDAEFGMMVVTCSDGRTARVDSYEAALSLARTWR